MAFSSKTTRVATLRSKSKFFSHKTCLLYWIGLGIPIENLWIICRIAFAPTVYNGFWSTHSLTDSLHLVLFYKRRQHSISQPHIRMENTFFHHLEKKGQSRVKKNIHTRAETRTADHRLRMIMLSLLNWPPYWVELQ